MKKLILSLALLAAFGASAQTVVATATQPTPVNPVVLSPNATNALTSNTTNKIFLDQSGDNPNLNLNQTGTGNKQGSSDRPVYLRGIDQTVTTIQTGDNNEIDLSVVNATTGDVGATVMIQQIGSGNQIDALCGTGMASDGDTELTGCNGANLNWKFTGDTNILQYRATGADQRSAITVTGNSNEFYIDSLTQENSQTIMVAGDNNIFNIKQTSNGASGSSALVDLTGNSNNLIITQAGGIDNVVNIKSISNSGTFNIHQRN
jgi:sulfopyruvate decarboxylase TPP-binding subunit